MRQREFRIEMGRHATTACLGAALLLLLTAANGCGAEGNKANQGQSGGGDGSGGGPFSGTGGSTSSLPDTSVYVDFPAEPVLANDGEEVPNTIPGLFGPATSGAQSGGPCLFEPASGALFPANWLRPRFRFSRPGHDVFELRLSAPNQKNELVVYTRAAEWKMPKPMWEQLALHSADRPITMTIRSAQLQGDALADKPALGSTGDFQIAPVAATGSIVYWTTTATDGELKGFKVGEESVVPVLKPAQVKEPESGGCIGCHTSTPDAKFVGVTNLGLGLGSGLSQLASIESETVGQAPSFWSSQSRQAVSGTETYMPTFSKAHWKDGDYTMLATVGGFFGLSTLNWFDLQATNNTSGASGTLARDGDEGSPIMANFSHDGQTVAYVSTPNGSGGFQTSERADIFAVPYANRQGGAAKRVDGAATSNFLEYYPAFSPDDRFIAYTRAPSNDEGTYANPMAEVFVVPSEGGTPTRLTGNDPVACTGDATTGLTNSWPKWSPTAEQSGGRTFYWLTFSSKRQAASGDSPMPPSQLYVTAIVVKDGQVQSYPALYLWNQPENESNHTPAWDTLEIPDVIPQ